MRTNMLNLVSVARSKGSATASSWRAYRSVVSGAIVVKHYDTHMISVMPDDTIVAIDKGWGSMTDKCGIRKILTNVNGQGYADIFGK